MRLDVSFRNLEPNDELRVLCDRKFQKVARYVNEPSEVHVVLRSEKHRQIAEVTLSSAGDQAHVAHAEDDEIRNALDQVFHKIERAVRRAHDRRIDRNRPHHVDATAELE